MCCDNEPKAPKPDPAIAINLAKQSAQADRLVKLAETSYADNKVRQVGVDALNEKATNLSMGIATKAAQRADDAYEFYQTKGRPLVEQTFDDAKNFDSAGNIAAARGRATADVAQAADNAEQQSQRALARMGINPSSNRFLALQQRMQAEKQAALAGAATNAEEGRRGGAIQLRQQASNLASGMPAQSLAQNGQALGANAQGSAISTSGLTTNMAINGQREAGIGQAGNLYGSAAGGGTNLYGQQLQASSINNQSSQASAGGWGQLAGIGLSMMADGGKVQGPGTGVSDDVPAVNKDTGQRIQLSNGEYVISADTVRALGTKYFDDLQAKHHKPVNLGRGA